MRCILRQTWRQSEPKRDRASLETILANDARIRDELANVDGEIEQSRPATTKHPEADIIRAKVTAYAGYLKHGTPALTPESAEMLRTNLETLIGMAATITDRDRRCRSLARDLEHRRVTGSAQAQLQHFARGREGMDRSAKPVYAASGYSK